MERRVPFNLDDMESVQRLPPHLLTYFAGRWPEPEPAADADANESDASSESDFIPYDRNEHTTPNSLIAEGEEALEYQNPSLATMNQITCPGCRTSIHKKPIPVFGLNYIIGAINAARRGLERIKERGVNVGFGGDRDAGYESEESGGGGEGVGEGEKGREQDDMRERLEWLFCSRAEQEDILRSDMDMDIQDEGHPGFFYGEGEGEVGIQVGEADEGPVDLLSSGYMADTEQLEEEEYAEERECNRLHREKEAAAIALQEQEQLQEPEEALGRRRTFSL